MNVEAGWMGLVMTAEKLRRDDLIITSSGPLIGLDQPLPSLVHPGKKTPPEHLSCRGHRVCELKLGGNHAQQIVGKTR